VIDNFSLAARLRGRGNQTKLPTKDSFSQSNREGIDSERIGGKVLKVSTPTGSLEIAGDAKRSLKYDKERRKELSPGKRKKRSGAVQRGGGSEEKRSEGIQRERKGPKGKQRRPRERGRVDESFHCRPWETWQRADRGDERRRVKGPLRTGKELGTERGQPPHIRDDNEQIDKEKRRLTQNAHLTEKEKFLPSECKQRLLRGGEEKRWCRNSVGETL